MAKENETEAEQVEITPEVQAIIDKAVAESTATLGNDLRTRDKTITKLQKDLEKSDPKSVEERLAAIEAERDSERKRADTTEAFSKAGLSNDFRELFSVDDPSERADRLASLLESRDSAMRAEIVSELTVTPGESSNSGSGRISPEDAKNMTPKEINDAFASGRLG